MLDIKGHTVLWHCNMAEGFFKKSFIRTKMSFSGQMFEDSMVVKGVERGGKWGRVGIDK